MIRTFNLGLIKHRLQRLAMLQDSDRLFDATIARREATGGAPPHPELAFSGFGADHLCGIVQRGLCSGEALGKPPGANSSNIWFKRGAPFYVDSPTLVIPAGKLLMMGGSDGVGLSGQKGVMKVPHGAAPAGIPIEEFAIVYALVGGWVVPVYKPSHWMGPAGEEVRVSDFKEWG